MLFKTEREKAINIGREYNFEPMTLGECKVVEDENGTPAGGAKEGQIIFMKQGPINLMPLIDHYEKMNTEMYGDRLKPILKAKSGMSER